MNYTHTIEKQEDGSLTIKLSISIEEVEKERKSCMEHIRESFEMEGFRRGKVPDNIIIGKVGTQAIFEHMAEHTLDKVYKDLLNKENITPLGQPEVKITKIAEGNPIEATLTISLLPEITLTDEEIIKIVEKVKLEKDGPTVTDDEITLAIKDLQRMRAHHELATKAGEAGEKIPSLTDVTDEQLPEFNDEWVATLGSFADIEDFKTRLKENLIEEKKLKQEERNRLAIIDTLVKKINLKTPEVLINYELSTLWQQLDHDLATQGLNSEEYLAAINKTKEDLYKDWQESAKKQADTHLLFNHIAALKQLFADEALVNMEVLALAEKYKDVKDFSKERAQAYISEVMTNQLVLAWLMSIQK